jgi:putative mRNA 3-end processing factor
MTRYERIEWISGVRVTTRETCLALDPASSRRFDKRVHQFISHAHADHTQCLSTRGVKYATASTKRIYEGIRKKPIMDFNEIKVNHSIRLADVEVTPINAGHMLGSIQLRITTPNKTLLYTGDLNCIDTLTTDRAESVECDLLLIEATFGNPYYIFPDRESTYAKIVEWATRQAKKQHIPTFHVYAAGKAQEIVKLFNLYTKLPVVVSPPVAAANEAYNSEGIKLRYETVDNGCEDDLFKSGPCVYVTTLSDRRIPEKCERAVATGWALGTANRFPAFPLSSHADFKQLIEFVKSTRAKTVYIFTGYSDFFASYLQNRYGIDARPIRSIAQKTLEISQ